MRYLLTLFILLLFSCPAWSDTDISLLWRGGVPNVSSNINSPIELGINDIDGELKNNPWLKENEELSVKYSNDVGEVKIIEINSI